MKRPFPTVFVFVFPASFVREIFCAPEVPLPHCICVFVFVFPASFVREIICAPEGRLPHCETPPGCAWSGPYQRWSSNWPAGVFDIFEHLSSRYPLLNLYLHLYLLSCHIVLNTLVSYFVFAFLIVLIFAFVFAFAFDIFKHPGVLIWIV